MTPKQIKNATTIELIQIYKSKARCSYCDRVTNSIFKELRNRLGNEKTYPLGLAHWHLQHGEGDAELNDECDKLIEATRLSG